MKSTCLLFLALTLSRSWGKPIVNNYPPQISIHINNILKGGNADAGTGPGISWHDDADRDEDSHDDSEESGQTDEQDEKVRQGGHNDTECDSSLNCHLYFNETNDKEMPHSFEYSEVKPKMSTKFLKFSGANEIENQEDSFGVAIQLDFNKPFKYVEKTDKEKKSKTLEPYDRNKPAKDSRTKLKKQTSTSSVKSLGPADLSKSSEDAIKDRMSKSTKSAAEGRKIKSFMDRFVFSNTEEYLDDAVQDVPTRVFIEQLAIRKAINMAQSTLEDSVY